MAASSDAVASSITSEGIPTHTMSLADIYSQYHSPKLPRHERMLNRLTRLAEHPSAVCVAAIPREDGIRFAANPIYRKSNPNNSVLTHIEMVMDFYSKFVNSPSHSLDLDEEKEFLKRVITKDRMTFQGRVPLTKELYETIFEDLYDGRKSNTISNLIKTHGNSAIQACLVEIFFFLRFRDHVKFKKGLIDAKNMYDRGDKEEMVKEQTGFSRALYESIRDNRYSVLKEQDEPGVHAELQLADAHFNRSQEPGGFVATSKLCCQKCKLAIDIGNDLHQGRGLKTSGAHNRHFDKYPLAIGIKSGYEAAKAKHEAAIAAATQLQTAVDRKSDKDQIPCADLLQNRRVLGATAAQKDYEMGDTFYRESHQLKTEGIQGNGPSLQGYVSSTEPEDPLESEKKLVENSVMNLACTIKTIAQDPESTKKDLPWFTFVHKVISSPPFTSFIDLLPTLDDDEDPKINQFFIFKSLCNNFNLETYNEMEKLSKIFENRNYCGHSLHGLFTSFNLDEFYQEHSAQAEEHQEGLDHGGKRQRRKSPTLT